MPGGRATAGRRGRRAGRGGAYGISFRRVEGPAAGRAVRPAPPRGLLPVVVQGGDQRAAAGVPGELPEEGAPQALVLLVGHLPGDGGRRVVAPPVAAAIRH